MLALARRNAAEAEVTNVHFLKGTIEAVPLPAGSVDVVISNCVINLSPDKGRALREAFRVLRSGGRFAVSDIVLQGSFPEGLRDDLQSWAGCVAGALEVNEYRRLLEEAGFRDVEFQVTRAHDPADLARSAGGCCGSADSGASCAGGSGASHAAPDGRIVSAFVRARRP
jgi:SAM-dependent methyltransferase